MFKIAAEIIQRVLNRYQRSGGLVLLLHIVGAVANNDADALEDMQFALPAAVRCKLAFDVAIKALRLRQRLLMGKNSVSVAGG